MCDGTLRTPDLRDKFIIGAGDTYAVDAVGGAVQHNHPFTGDGHTHQLVPFGEIEAGADFNKIAGPGTATGTTDNGATLAPYYALAYIMYRGRIR